VGGTGLSHAAQHRQGLPAKEEYMGFWDTAGKLAKNVAKDALDSSREMKAIHDRLDGQSSTALKKIVADDGYFSGATEMEKRLARKTLRDRGES
jgi:hypothetical protein